LPKGVTTKHFLNPLSSSVFLLRPMALVVVLFGGAFFILAPLRGALVCAIDFKPVALLILLLGGGIVAKGTMVIVFASSLMKVLSGTRSIEDGTPSRLFVEQEAM